MKDLVQAARGGALSRRGFLAAALALGLGEREAERELAVKVAVPAPRLVRISSVGRIHQPFRDSLLAVPSLLFPVRQNIRCEPSEGHPGQVFGASETEGLFPGLSLKGSRS